MKPLSKAGNNNWGGMGVTLIDSLDTLWLMGLKEEFYNGRYDILWQMTGFIILNAIESWAIDKGEG